jgi:hypothetical protein
LGALATTAAAHFVYVVVGDGVAALIGFVAGYANCAHRSSRSPSVEGDPPPFSIVAARRAAVIAAALVLVMGDRALYRMGMHGLGRKLGAVALATAVFALGAWLSRWPRTRRPRRFLSN